MGRVLFSMTTIFVLLLIQLNFLVDCGSSNVGLNYGMLGNNLPTPSQVISLVKSRNIGSVRLFNPNPDVLNALQNTGVELILGTLNQDLQNLASSDTSYAKTWVQSYVVPYAKTVKFRCIAAGNEVIPGDLANFVFPAMVNLNKALIAYNLQIPVSTSVATSVLGNSFPPSKGEFSSDVTSVLQSISTFLAKNQFPLLVNVYPYFSYINNPSQISLSYALFNSTKVVVKDGKLGYKNLFDATIDAVYSALEKTNGNTVEIVVSESGWPSKGNGDVTTINIAQTYNQNLVKHVLGNSGTPKRPGKSLEAYVFAIFNENQKSPGTEQNFGLFYPNMTQVYHVDFTA